MAIILDSSAILALLWKEPGADAVAASLNAAAMSTVNASEVVAKMVDRGISGIDAETALLTLGFEVADFDTSTAVLAGQIRRPTKSLGLSLGDRACIALGMTRQNKILTADRAWASVDLDVEIELIR